MAMLNTSAIDPGTYVFGPMSVLSAEALSLVSQGVWSRNVGETSCGWRTDYSPDGRAFGIWSVIYLGTFGVSVAQLTNMVKVFDWWTNFFWAMSWAFCTLWVPLFDAEYPGALRAAALQIAAAAACGTGATWRARMWVADTPAGRAEQVALGWPLTLLAGWLLAAASINFGIAWKASQPNALRTCVRVPPRRGDESEMAYRRRRRVLYREAYAMAPAVVSPVPVVLSLVVGGLAVGARDPVLVTPLMWAIVNLKAFPSFPYLISLLICACGSVGAVLRIFFL